MRVLVLSDLHFEFHKDGGTAFLADLPKENIDLVILAGDICLSDQIPVVLGMFCKAYIEAKVIYLHGNHEFYHSDRQEVIGYTQDALADHDNLIWLDNDVVELDGVRIVGAPMWFRDPPPEVQPFKRQMNDFAVIEGFEDWVYEENAKARAFFDKEVRKGDVVITHYVPTFRSVHPRYVGSPLNAFFVCDQEDLILEREPRIWIHGHTHDSFDYLLGSTQVTCNPFGYVRLEENQGFDPAKIIDL